MSDAAGSSITDLLINQPVLVWSLAGGLAILVLAGLLSVFLALRSRFSKARAAKEASREQRKGETAVKTAVTETKPTNEPASAKSAKQKRPEPAPAPAEPAPANEAIADDQKGFSPHRGRHRITGN
jgi:predicted lipid-binding transport protein (Tim44 family)